MIITVRSGHLLWGWLGYAHICDGSVVRKTTYGLTQKSAEKRALKALDNYRPI